MSIPLYVEERLRRPTPEGLCIVPGSTPVLSFGPPHTAWIATLGLNPSRVEFRSGKGRELRGKKRRLATLASLATADLETAPIEVLERVVEGCGGYFQRNPYRRWFDQLELVLAACGGSYYDGSACHLDLVQWATDPTWGKLDSKQRASLLAADAPFLLQQLQSERLRVVLVNGAGVLRRLQNVLGLQLEEKPPIAIEGRRGSQLFAGTTRRGVLIVGWTVNLQSSFGVTNELRRAIADRVGALVTGRSAPPAVGVDGDLDQLSREQLIAEAKRLRAGIRQHRDSTGHELCWHHPDLWALLPERSDPKPAVPSWPQFLQGCLEYRQSLDEQLPDAPRSSAAYEDGK